MYHIFGIYLLVDEGQQITTQLRTWCGP